MNIHLAKHYLKHQIRAKNAHSLHSPFVFEFYNECIKNKSTFYQFIEIESARNQLLKNKKAIQITDYGAGSKVNQNKKRLIKDIAKHSLKQPFLAQQLFRIVNYLKPENIIDIGTSLGITTSYLASVNKNTKVITLEGCANTSKIAQRVFDKLQLKNVEIIEGEFSKSIHNLINNLDTVDFVFFDGNHQYEPTIEYFNILKQKSNEHTCFIFDDIYWSSGMKKAWLEIIKSPDVTLSIDTFYFGIIFFRTNQPKQHFVLKQ